MTAVPGLGASKPPSSAASRAEGLSSAGSSDSFRSQTTKDSRSKSQKRRKAWKAAATGIKVGMAMFSVLVIYLNILPYKAAAEFLSSEGGQEAYPLLNWLLDMPVLGSLITWMASMDFWVQGFFLWLMFQCIELLPKLIENDPDASQKAIALARTKKSASYTKFDSDDRLTRYLRQKQSHSPSSLVAVMYTAALVAYFFDFIVSTIQFPPLKSGTSINSLTDFFRVGNWMRDIDWMNVFLILLTMFAVELIVFYWGKLNRLIEELSDKADKKSKYAP